MGREVNLILFIAAIIPTTEAPPRFDYFESNTVCSWECGDDGIYFQKLNFRQLIFWRWEPSLDEHVVEHWVMQGTDPQRMKPDPVFISSRGVWQVEVDGRLIEARGFVKSAADYDLEVANQTAWPKCNRRGLRK